MTALDIILLACFLPAIWYGFKKGLISQLISIISLILSVWVAFKFSTLVAAWLGGWLDVSEAALKVAAYVVIFIGVALVMNAIRILLEKIIKFVMLGWVNKTFGMVLAALWTALLLGLVIMLFNSLNTHFNLVKEETLAPCQVYAFLKEFAYAVFPYMKEMLL